MRQIPRGIGEGKNIILVVGEMLKSRIKKMQKECWRNAEKISPLYWAGGKNSGKQFRSRLHTGRAAQSVDQQSATFRCFLSHAIKTNIFQNLDKYTFTN